MVVLKKVALIVLLLSISACTASKKSFEVSEPSLEKGSVVYLYRPHDVSNIILKSEIDIDGENAQALSSGEYRQIYLQPGEHLVNLLAVEGYTSAEQLVLNVEPGSVHYLRLSSSLSMETGVRYSAYKRKFELEEVTPSQALKKLASCRDVEALASNENSTTDAVETKVQDSADSRFSLDKTRNPFSR